TLRSPDDECRLTEAEVNSDSNLAEEGRAIAPSTDPTEFDVAAGAELAVFACWVGADLLCPPPTYTRVRALPEEAAARVALLGHSEAPETHYHATRLLLQEGDC